MKMKKRNKTLQRIIIKSKTERFFTWFEVAWPHARPLMTNLINHISCKDISPSDVILLNILRATRSAMNRPDPAIVIDKSRLDREYLIIFYRSLLTAAARELSDSAHKWKRAMEPSESKPIYMVRHAQSGLRHERAADNCRCKRAQSHPVQQNGQKDSWPRN